MRSRRTVSARGLSGEGASGLLVTRLAARVVPEAGADVNADDRVAPPDPM